MKVVLVVTCLLSLAFASLEEEANQWTNFKQKHAKVYSNIQEEKLRFSIFQQNLKIINEHNQRHENGLETYSMGVNRFSDMTNEEYSAILTKQSLSKPEYRRDEPISLQGDIPESKDWREVGAVSKVKDQGTCGSCWAFSAVATVESFYYLKNNKMVTFSEQYLVNCDDGDNGCGGGDEAPALEFIKMNGKKNLSSPERKCIVTEDSYPYDGKTKLCLANWSAVYTDVKGYVKLNRSEDDLLQVVGLLGPVSVALDASGLSFYNDGDAIRVYTSSKCYPKYTNHAVLAVGYGHDEASGMDYWLMKNSWGATWGQEGYFKIQRGVNMCSVNYDNVYPIL